MSPSDAPAIPAITDRFNAALTADPERGRRALELLASRAARDPYLQTTVHSPLLTRPAFLTAAQRDTLQDDVSGLVELLLDLPDRLFGGRVEEMCRVTGFDAAQSRAVAQTWRDREVVLARSDLLQTADGFKALEVNIHSSLGGIDSGPWHKAYMRLPVCREFIAAEGLGWVDPMDGVADSLRAATDARGLGAGERPVVAIVDWPSTFPIFAERLHRVAALLERHGFEAFACHAGELSLRNGRLVCGEREIDVLYRIFLLGDVPEAPSLLDPILESHARGTLLLAMGFAAELAGNKAALALLSAGAADGRLSPEEQALVRRIVPWTRLTVAGDGVDELRALALREQDRLVLKPADGHAARDVYIGAITPAEEWEAVLDRALGAFWVLQERVQPVGELMPRIEDDGSLGFEEFDVNWGVFTFGRRYGGAMLRATPSAGAGLISASHGAAVGCCFCG